MRKRNISHLFDCLFWWGIALFPLLLYLCMSFKSGLADVASFDTFYALLGIDFTDNVVYSVLADVFGSTGVFPLVGNNGALIPFVWLIAVQLIHLVVDVLLFIPRWCHQLMYRFGGKDE